jgi:hypothetical protein
MLEVAERIGSGDDGGGSDLPAVDNDYIITATFTPEEVEVVAYSNILHDGESVTLADVIAAVESGKNVRVIATDNMSVGITLDFVSTLAITGSAVYLIGLSEYSRGMQLLVMRLYEDDGEIVAESASFTQPPYVSAANNGKILGVDNGRYSLLSPEAVNDYEVVLTSTGPGEYAATHNGNAVSVSDVIAAAVAKKNVFVTHTDSGVTVKMPLTSYDSTSVSLAFGCSTCTADLAQQTLVETRYFGIGFVSGSDEIWGIDTSN